MPDRAPWEPAGGSRSIDDLAPPPPRPPDVGGPNETLAETAKDAAEQVKAKASQVSKAELEAFLSQAVRLFLRGGLDLHHEGKELPDFEVRLTEDTLVVNVRRLDSALAWRLAEGPSDVAPPGSAEEQVLDKWRVFVLMEDEPIAAFGRGIPGVQVRTGRASFLLFKDFLKGLVADKTAAAREKERRSRREVLRREIEHLRERTGDGPLDATPPRVQPGEEDLTGPGVWRTGP